MEIANQRVVYIHYTLTNNAGGRFAIDSSTGVVVFLPKAT